MRPSWTNYFLGLAFVASQRSHDIHTQHGCVITDSNNRILSIGYNGFPRNAKDDELPLERPAKYFFIVHSEISALANCLVRPTDGIAYVTGQCCNNCALALWQNGIKKIVMANRHGSALLNEETKKAFDKFVETTGIEIEYITPDLSFLQTTVDKFVGV